MRRLLAVAVVLAIAAIIGLLWLPAIRIQNVSVAGQDQSGMQAIAQADITGSYYFLFPKDSIFFFPEGKIRADILARYPDISAVSIARTSFSTVLLSSVGRATAFLWCGASYTGASVAPATVASSTAGAAGAGTTTPPAAQTGTYENDSSIGVLSPCYDADSEGFIFAQDTNAAQDSLRVYGPLQASGGAPVGSHIANASSIPPALTFVKAIQQLGVPIVALVLRGSEADLYAQSGTRITYVLGQEQTAYQLAQSAFSSLNLNDGTLEYVDLRFQGKVYFKKK